MAKQKGVIAFDFDRVIGDSVKECYVQSVKAYADVGSELKANQAVERKFREARPLITKVEHFFTVMRLIEQNPRIRFSKLNQADFNREYAKDETRASEFTKRFYARRQEMQKTAPREWLALQGAFPGVARIIKKIQKSNQVFIATTKDKASVAELLRSYGIQIPEQNILAREFSLDKREQLKEIARKAGVQPNQIILVEDAVEQLKKVSEIGARGVLARWGYSTKAQKREARKERIPIIRRGITGTVARMKIRKQQKRRR